MPRSTDMRGRTVYFIDHECLWPRAVRHPPTATRADPSRGKQLKEPYESTHMPVTPRHGRREHAVRRQSAGRARAACADIADIAARIERRPLSALRRTWWTTTGHVSGAACSRRAATSAESGWSGPAPAATSTRTPPSAPSRSRLHLDQWALALAQRHLRLGVRPLDQRPTRMALGARPLGQARAGMGVHRRPLGALMRLGAPCVVGRQYGRRRAEPPFLPLYSADNIGYSRPPREANARPPAAVSHHGAPRRHIDFRR